VLRHEVGKDKVDREFTAERLFRKLLVAQLAEDAGKVTLLESEGIVEIHASTLVTHRELLLGDHREEIPVPKT
jgi:hypothetical protein